MRLIPNLEGENSGEYKALDKFLLKKLHPIT